MLTPTLGAAELARFSADYRQARHQFLDAITPLAPIANHRVLDYDGQGPHGESLHTDTVWIGPPAAGRVLVLISATHGVEGFAGSAIQTDLLLRLADVAVWPHSDLAILLVHALNPHGFAWLRRCNEEGIDLNRNFVNFAAPLPGNPGYTALASAILPTDDDWTSATAQLHAWLANHGQREYELAVSGGQYTHPAGLFFGGQHPSQARRHIEQLITHYQLDQRQLAVIDLHTGLGPFGYGEIICDHEPDSRGTAAARRWYGDAVTLPAEGSSTSVPKHGLLDYAWHAIMNNAGSVRDSCFVTLEFGTYPVAAMFEALRRDHCLHAQGKPDWNAARTREIKAALRRQFYPDTAEWKAMVLFQGRQTIDMAMRGLLSD